MISKWVLLAALFFSHAVSAKSPITNFDIDAGVFKDPFYLLFFFIGIALLPFIAIMVTSFAKIVVVLSIARQAIGTAQTPPNIVIMSLAIILTCFSMYPMGVEIYNKLDRSLIEKGGKEALFHFFSVASVPIRQFLDEHAHQENRELFLRAMQKAEGPVAETIKDNDFIILAPSFLISELSRAFQIGFLIYLPFLVVDMTIANLLMALGMQMLSPTTISLPFKILLFVLVDGWRLISEGLVKV